MLNSEFNSHRQMPNFLLVAGNGRNVGKTYFVCKLIEHLSQTTDVTGIKISSHFHPYNEADVLFKNERYVILEEKQITKKDSSLMLQAGAQKVYFIMVPQEHIAEAFAQVKSLLPDHAIVCESGGLHEIIDPGLFFFVNQPGQNVAKTQHLKYNPIVVNNDGTNLDFEITNVRFSNHTFYLAL